VLGTKTGLSEGREGIGKGRRSCMAILDLKLVHADHFAAIKGRSHAVHMSANTQGTITVKDAEGCLAKQQPADRVRLRLHMDSEKGAPD
jgi:hypothetical protein